MRPTSEALIRVALTILVVGALILALSRADYDYNFGAIWGYRGLFLKGLGMTVLATAVAYLIGLVGGVAVALSRMSRSLPIRHLGDLYVETIRGTPFLVQLSIAYFGIAPLLGIDNKFGVGTLALGMFAAAYIGEIFRAGIESVERGQFEAGRSLGLTRTQTLRHIVFPQAFKRMIPPLTGEMIALTKESSLLFVIGIVELMAVARQAGFDSYNTFEAYAVGACLYLTITVPLSLLARRLERRLGVAHHLGAHL